MLANSETRSDQPENRTAGSMLLTAFALSDNNLLTALREPQVLQRVELSLHSCKVLAAQDVAWLPVWHAVHDLQQVLASLVLVGPVLDEPFSEEQVLHMWNEIGSGVSILQRKLR
jgi:hypothetical protein